MERGGSAGTAGLVPSRHEPPLRVVHLVSKTHLDLGFTALAAEVAHQYVTDFFPRAVAVARELRERGGVERLVWTTGAWPLWWALEHAAAPDRRAIEQAVVDGDLAWHALAVTTHTELMDPALVRTALGFSAELDARFGRRTVAAKMTDVPGHTRGLVPLLAEAGVRLLHVGVNPAWPVPDVPPVFRWRGPGGAEVVVVYQRGGYGGFRAVDGSAEALAFAHTGDNLGPPTVAGVLAAQQELRDALPGVEVRASTLDAFTRALDASGAVDRLPVVTAEIGDAWIFGGASDPQKVARDRELRRVLDRGVVPASVAEAARRELLLVAEHTWGLDQKEALPDLTRWDRAGLASLRSEPATRRFESSWAEQRAYVDRAEAIVRDALPPGEHVLDAVRGAGRPTRPDPADGLPPGAQPVAAGDVIDTPWWAVGIDGTGAVTHLRAGPGGPQLADAQHPIARLGYQTFDEGSYARFAAALTPAPADEWWARLDNTKPGIDACGALAAWWEPEVSGAWYVPASGDAHHELVVLVRFPAAASGTFGAAPAWRTCVRWTDGPEPVEVEVAWFDKPACRLPEAAWCSFVPIVAEPDRWTLDKLGRPVSPLDVVAHGGRALHGVGHGMAYDGPDGRLRLGTLDAPLVAPGRPNLLDADPDLPDLAGGFHVLLHDNLWGTNFPMWSEGDARFRFTIDWSSPGPG